MHKEGYTMLVEREILAWFREAIFMPLLIILHEYEVPVDPKFQAIKYDEAGRVNAPVSALEEALKSGRVQYASGVFSGQFGAKISKELRSLGATFDRESKVFHLAPEALPMDLRGVISLAQARSVDVHEQVLKALTAMQENVAASTLLFNFDAAVDRITEDLYGQFVKTTSSVEGIAIPAKLSDVQRKQLTEDLTDNVALSIKDFASERIPEMRRRIEENVFKGARTPELAKILEAEFGMDKRKANFVADQEAGLLTAKYRQSRYEAIGVREYIWSTSHDNRVRPDHALLNGKRFSFSNPPVCNRATGKRCNPGEDFRCRCVARPVVTLQTAA